MRLPDIAIRERFGLRAWHRNETGEFFRRNMKAGVDHAQWRKQTVLQELLECLARDDFNDTAENVVTDGIFPDFARLVQKR